MILTDKAKEDFLKWSFEKQNYQSYAQCLLDYAKKSEPETNALIIEWLDSVGIYINTDIDYEFRYFNYKIEINEKYEDLSDYVFNTRNEATQKAIIKANEIYNNLNTKENEK